MSSRGGLFGDDRASDDEFSIRLGGSGGKSDGIRSGAFGARLTKMFSGRKMGSAGTAPAAAGKGWGAGRSFGGFDSRQRVIVKVSFKNHGKSHGGFRSGGSSGISGGSGGSLSAHGRYLERDGAGRDGERGEFFGRDGDEIELARDRLQEWERDDPRHFRLVLAPESGARLIGEHGDLKDYTRDVMEGMERDLGQRLDWLAVEHANTDNPHVHVILRGVREDGLDLHIPREYMAHGIRKTARDVATEHLGPRGLEDERLRLGREIEARGLTRLDQSLEQELDHDRRVRLQDLGRDDDRMGRGDALRARLRELEARGLAVEVKRNVLQLSPDWKVRLEAARSLDVSRELRTARLYEPHFGHVLGEIERIGPRGENGERALLIMETEDRGRLLLNTSLAAVRDLSPGQIVELIPSGRRADIEPITHHPARDLTHAIGDTQLDRELDRIAKGQDRELPRTNGVERALDEREDFLLEARLGARDSNGLFHFMDGAREKLASLECEQLGRELTKQSGQRLADPSREPEQGWTLRETRKLFSGRVGVLERGDTLSVVPVAKDIDLKPGDRMRLERSHSQELGLGHGVQAVKDLSRELSRGRSLGLDIGMGR